MFDYEQTCLFSVSSRCDPATAEAVSMALEEIHALGAPPTKIASF
jgi:hypothetical protein